MQYTENKKLFWLWRFLYRIWYYLAVLPIFTLILTPVLGFFTYIFSFFNIRLAFYMGVIWARATLGIACLRVRVAGTDHIDHTQSYVVVVNHQSALDILAIYGHLPIDFRWVMKMELRKVPIIGGGCARIQHVYIDRSDPEKAIASLKAARTQLVNGTSIVFFPEGTRSRTDQMLPFKKGAFRMAVDLQLPVLPITLRNTGQLMRKWGFEAKPGTIDMVIHPPIPVDDLCDDDVPKLMQQAREVIQSGIDRPFPSL